MPPTSDAPLLRYERKFVPDGLSVPEVLGIVRLHPALFREVYPERAVNNLYLDSPDLRHYHDHIEGAANRVKVRVRWYGAFGGRVERPRLEFKLKHGLVGRKESRPLPGFALNGHSLRETLATVFAAARLPDLDHEHLRWLQPVLANRYHRRYFCSADRSMRLTVDHRLEFGELRNARAEVRTESCAAPAVIVELKYDREQSDLAARIADALPFRLTRCSKYVLGIESSGLL